jgi:Bacterial PH domain
MPDTADDVGENMSVPEGYAKPARYRFISPWAYVTGPIACLVALRVSVLLAVVVLLVLTGLIAVLLRVGSDMSAEGVNVRHVRSRSFLPWGEIREVRTVQDWNFGTRIVVVAHDGRPVVLPAPTSKTGRFTEGLARVRDEIARRQQ